MIIDIHTHTFPEKMAPSVVASLSHKAHITPHTEGTPAALARSMERAGIDRSVILPVATAARQVEHLNDASARLCGEWEREGLISFGCMHPDFDGYREELSRVKSLGLKGIKIHPVYQETNIDDVRFLRILDRCAELGLIVLTHAGLDIGYPGVDCCSPAMCRRAALEVGPFPFILAHMGGWKSWDEVPALLADTGVYLDTAFSGGRIEPLAETGPDQKNWTEEERQMLDARGFCRLIGAFGADRILFGTDSPWEDQMAGLQRMMELPLAEADREKILGGNAAALLGLAD